MYAPPIHISREGASNDVKVLTMCTSVCSDSSISVLFLNCRTVLELLEIFLLTDYKYNMGFDLGMGNWISDGDNDDVLH